MVAAIPSANINDAETSNTPSIAFSNLRGHGPQGKQHGAYPSLSSNHAATMRLVYLLLPLSLGLPITIPVEGTEVYQLQHQHQHPEYHQQQQQQTILAQNHSEENQSQSQPSSSSHGSIINLNLNLRKLKPNPNPDHQSKNNNNNNNTNQPTDKIFQAYLHTLHTSHLCAHTLSQYGPELLALALFSLLPITLCILALAERISRSWTVEAYPERGRDRRRFLGRERRCLMQARREREKRAVLERGWWIAERKR
ncbi:chitinase-3-like protein 2 [Aspergillus viridinutans]|uniref:Chitinase-3-like protein 2 n=1 Tax=Aspergillus viridinutans TaxID=75553 RepID=A0A9P3F438_ASPVI|nr:chitinase-3-like protein 2 [Aspergillus viridinutans]GIK01165.1 chitinase-3-like protein 2 [Aspergillus viridinutans]